MRERQAVVFGVLLAALAVVGLGAAAVYTESLDLPFMNRDFEAEPTPTPTRANFPCPPEGALPVAYSAITVNVYNSTTTGGLAAATQSQLVERGFTAGSTGNQPEYDGTARITFGAQGVAAGYTLAEQFTTVTFLLDGRQDATVDVTLGTDFEALVAPEEITLDPTVPLVAPAGCTPYADIVEPAPTVSASPTPAAG
ncbi:LytR C-terminal domain-containing protein [Cellulomonas composti]|nr:LytR C-terminal domain-containing protein [Cellulomonas composti]